MVKAMHDNINHPKHYTGFSNGSEVIDITENCTFNAGNAIKYAARAGRTDGNVKGNILEDLNKAKWYIEREIKRLETGISAEAEEQEDNRDLTGWLDTLPSGVEVRTRRTFISFVKLLDGSWVSSDEYGNRVVYSSAGVNRCIAELGEGVAVRRIS